MTTFMLFLIFSALCGIWFQLACVTNVLGVIAQQIYKLRIGNKEV